MKSGIAIRAEYLVVALACGVTLLLYAVGIGEYLLFDSLAAIGENDALHHVVDGGPAHWWAAIDSSGSGPTGRLVSMLSFALEAFARGGVDAAGIRVTNIVIHILTGLAAYALMRELFSARLPRWTVEIAVILWLLHPLHVSSVLYTVQRMTQLSALFVLLGLLIYTTYRQRWLERAATPIELSYCAFWVFLSGALATFSKENGVLLLALLFLIESLVFRGRYNGFSSDRLAWLLRLGLLVPLALLALFFVFPPEYLVNGYQSREFTLEQRAVTQLRVVWQYVVWIALPDIRAMGLHHDDIVTSIGLFEPGTGALALFVWLILLVSLVVLVRRGCVITVFALCWFLYGHLLESSLLALEMVYEHRNYLPSLGLCLFIALLISRLSVVRMRVAVAIGLGLLLAFLLFGRSTIWQSELDMAGYHRHHHPDSVRSVYHFANAMLRHGEESAHANRQAALISRSRQGYIDMLELRPDDVVALVTLLYLDGKYFQNQASKNWMQQLHSAIDASFIDASDQRAMAALLECIQLSICNPAEVDFKKLMQRLSERYPDTYSFNHLVSVYAATVEKDYRVALATDQQILLQDPEFIPAHRGKYRWYLAKGENGQALETLRSLMGVSPDLNILLDPVLHANNLPGLQE